MKRFTLILALVLMMAMPTRAERVSPENARKVATTFLGNNGVKTTQLTDLTQKAGFSNLYIFTTEEGFVVMSADDCIQPILGYSLTGKFVTEGMPENVRGWLQGYSDEIQYAIDNQMRASNETAQLWKDLADGNSKAGLTTLVVAPLIQTKWDQTKYYNRLCPEASDGYDGHVLTGCVATAMAQIMKYWNYPTRGIGSHSYNWNNQTLSATFGTTTYDWSNMQPYYDYYYVNGTDEDPILLGTPSTEQITAVATLMYHCGVSIEMDYGSHGSNAYTFDVADALKNHFNYSPNIQYLEKEDYNDATWTNMVKTELNALRPLEYCGSDPNGYSGHAFVCDGYDDRDYFHFNWGWSGCLDGYFSLENLDTGANNQSGSGYGNYTAYQAAVFGIQPVQCAASNPTNLTYSLDGSQNLTLNWAVAEGAARYNIYRNNSYVGSSTTNSYSEIAPFGINDYYVRSVDANDNLSLSSNIVSVTIPYPKPIVNDLSATLSGNNASLSWTAPDWCYPETPSDTLTYGDGNISSFIGYGGSEHFYWGHRYPTTALQNYIGMVVYKISFYTSTLGPYQCFIYQGTTSDRPKEQIANTSFTVSSKGWFDIDLNENHEIDGTKDLWVFIYDPEYKSYPASYCYYNSENNEGCYCSTSDPKTYLETMPSDSKLAWLIRTYLTDGTYTYNLYQDGTAIVEELNSTTFNATLNDNAANLFTVKTNYYAGETDASNIVGFAKGSASLNGWEMASTDKMTLTEGSTLTVSGNLVNTNPANLILEDGAQLIHNSDDVQATVKKAIEPYTANDNGWYFIASPVMESITPSVENGFLPDGSTYDLYYYEESAHHWRNYRVNNFDLAYKQGYLYANNVTTTLQFAGTLTPSNDAISINNLSHEATILNGFNLVGNPFACNATIDQDCYVISGEQVTKLAAASKVFAPCESAFVKATSDEYTVTFTKSGAKGNSNRACLDLVVTQGDGQNAMTFDRARVRLGEGTNMEKFNLNDGDNISLTIRQDGQDFAVAYANGMDELPLNFKTAENGTYSIGIETNTLDLDYLHLIDNLTGNDVDLLATPSYTFEAKTIDYTSRFKLVFSNCEDSAGDNETFAFIDANSNIIVSVPSTGSGAAMLQIVDMTGHMIYQGDAKHCVPTSGMVSGVYVLRLITANGVKTQKIVIE